MATYRDVITGLEILARAEGYDKHGVCAEHDEIYAGHDATELSEQDLLALEKAGWFRDEEVGGWKRFV